MKSAWGWRNGRFPVDRRITWSVSRAIPKRFRLILCGKQVLNQKRRTPAAHDLNKTMQIVTRILRMRKCNQDAGRATLAACVRRASWEQPKPQAAWRVGIRE
uniref:Transposase n=1 Tax=Ascaris lumbricoides TaxID=6252 RepID=A0A0M3I6G2_ASCLU